MPQSCPDPTLDVAGDEILVTMRGTSYAVTYLKRGGAPGLLAKDFMQNDDPCICPGVDGAGAFSFPFSCPRREGSQPDG